MTANRPTAQQGSRMDSATLITLLVGAAISLASTVFVDFVRDRRTERREREERQRMEQREREERQRAVAEELQTMLASVRALLYTYDDKLTDTKDPQKALHVTEELTSAIFRTLALGSRLDSAPLQNALTEMRSLLPRVPATLGTEEYEATYERWGKAAIKVNAQLVTLLR